MPIKNVEPEMAFTVIVNSPKHYGIFHAYEDDQWDKRCDFVYSTDILERRDFDFDIREIKRCCASCLTGLVPALRSTGQSCSMQSAMVL